MKRICLFCLLIITISFLLVGCSSVLENNKIDSEEMLENVTMVIKDGTLTKTGATIIINDLNGDDNTYGESYRIDKKVNGKWQKLDVVIEGEYGFHAIGYTVNENNTLEMNIDWNWLYGELPSGEYRLVKDAAVTKNNTYIGSKYVYVEFVI
ncbi:MAG: hypothetical protein IJN13_04160 [Bacilli bacterium]|nr:hypothetical protein [Bacilli bacterium]